MALQGYTALLIGVASLWLVLLLLSRSGTFKRFNLEVKPFLLAWRTRAFNNFLSKLGKKHKRFWKIVGNLALAQGIGMMVYAMVFLAQNMLLLQRGEGAPVVPIIPGITLSLAPSTLIPLLLIIALVIVFHEFAHGILCEVEDVQIKSCGLLFVAVIPGAFVEPETSSLESAPPISKLRIFSAGSFANLVVGLLLLFVVLNPVVFGAIISPFYQASAGVVVLDVDRENPSTYANIAAGDAILRINGSEIRNVYDFLEYMSRTKPWQVLNVTLLHEGSLKNVLIKLVPHPRNETTGYMGVAVFNYYPPRNPLLPPLLPYYAYSYLNYLALFSLSIAIFNSLPIPMLDGDKVLLELLSSLPSKWAIPLSNVIRAVAVLLLVGNVALSLLGMHSMISL